MDAVEALWMMLCHFGGLWMHWKPHLKVWGAPNPQPPPPPLYFSIFHQPSSTTGSTTSWQSAKYGHPSCQSQCFVFPLFDICSCAMGGMFAQRAPGVLPLY